MQEENTKERLGGMPLELNCADAAGALVSGPDYDGSTVAATRPILRSGTAAAVDGGKPGN